MLRLTALEPAERWLRKDASVESALQTRPRLAALLFLILGFWLVLPANLYPAEQVIAEKANLLDDSWRLELPHRATRGQWSGRDFTFTYGPLYQALHASGAVFEPGNTAALFRFNDAPAAILAALVLWLVLCLSGAPLLWRGLLFLFWCALFNLGLKPWAGLAALALLCDGFARTAILGRPALARAVSAGIAGLAAPIITLYAFDLGILTLIGILALCLVAAAATLRTPGSAARELRIRALISAAAALLGFVAFAGLLALTPWSGFMSRSWELAMGYTSTMAEGFQRSKHPGWMLLRALGVTVVGVLALRALRRELREAGGPAEEPLDEQQRAARLRGALVLGASALFAMLWLRYGLSRSDKAHVLVSMIPASFLLACQLPCALRAADRSRVLTAVLVLVMAFFAYKVWGIGKNKRFYRRIAAPFSLQLSASRWRIDDAPLARAIQESEGSGPLLVWPFESLVNILADRPNPVDTVQLYAGTTPSLSARNRAAISGAAKLEVLVFRDSWPIDDVANLSRSSAAFAALLEGFQLSAPPTERFARLKRSTMPRGRWEELDWTPARWRPGEAPHTLSLPPGLRASDVLRLTLRATKTRRFGVFKPGWIDLGYIFDDKVARRRKQLLAQDGEPATVLIRALRLDEPLFLSVFQDGRCWESREPLRALEFTWRPLDGLSRRPELIEVLKVEAWRPAAGERRLAPLEDQQDPELQAWCFRRGG